MFIFWNTLRGKSTLFFSQNYSLQRVQILNDSLHTLIRRHTARGAFMNLSFAFFQDVSLGHLWRDSCYSQAILILLP